jgi:hypothetical protein
VGCPLIGVIVALLHKQAVFNRAEIATYSSLTANLVEVSSAISSFKTDNFPVDEVNPTPENAKRLLGKARQNNALAVISFFVSVPVLSDAITVAQPNDSTTGNFLNIDDKKTKTKLNSLYLWI